MVETRSVCQKAGQTGRYVLGQSVQKAFSLRLRKGKKTFRARRGVFNKAGQRGKKGWSTQYRRVPGAKFRLSPRQFRSGGLTRDTRHFVNIEDILKNTSYL